MSPKTIAARYRRSIRECIANGDVMGAEDAEAALRDFEFNLWAATR